MNRPLWNHRITKLLAGLALFFSIALLAPSPAAAQVQAPGTFSATRSCAAPRAINGANPGNIQISPKQRYEAIGFNSNERKFVLIRVPNAQPDRRWVSVNCGKFTPQAIAPDDDSDKPNNSPNQPANNTTLLPFFDTENNPEFHKFPAGTAADITPPPPVLNAFDQDVLKTCGPIGTKVKADAFKQLMANHPEVLSQVKAAVGGELLPNRDTDTEFLDDLSAAWSDREGFEHIFCGELENASKIGGLHFVGRYFQLQNDKIGGRLANNLNKEEVEPGVIHTLGVVVTTPDGKTWKDDLKGYGYLSNAEELLVDGTRLLKAQGNRQGACLADITDDDTGKAFQAVFVKDKNAVVTFFPDATPGGKRCQS